MTFAACAGAESNPRSAERANGCFSCQARMFAAIGGHEESISLKKITPQFKEALQEVFGDRWHEASIEVKQWGKRIDSMSKRKVTA